MNKFGIFITLFVSATLLSGCLQTRETQKEKEEKQVLKKQLTNLQQNTADINARFQDIEDEARRSNGRMEALEARVQQQIAQQAAAAAKNEKTVLETRLRERDEAYREEFAKVQGELSRLREQVAALQAEQKRSAQQAASSSSASNSNNPYADAEALFEKKSWREAILSYERYRSRNPKGKFFSAATYKIGVCFQELGMNEEAAVFYEEVVAKFPKSKDAGRASTRLKKLKTAKK